MKRLPLLGASILAAGAVAAVLVVWEPWSGGGVRSVTEVPIVLPRAGVNINSQAVLKPLATPPAAALSASQAIKAARHFANAHPFTAHALEVSATLVGSPKVRDIPAWIVTFTSPKPVNVMVGGPATTTKQFVTHFSVALDATTGKMLFGIFTK
jgi:hypothetical protein